MFLQAVIRVDYQNSALSGGAPSAELVPPFLSRPATERPRDKTRSDSASAANGAAIPIMALAIPMKMSKDESVRTKQSEYLQGFINERLNDKVICSLGESHARNVDSFRLCDRNNLFCILFGDTRAQEYS